MQPHHIDADRPTLVNQASVMEYCKRMMQYGQMDIEVTFSQLKDLCIDPRKVYQLTAYRFQTKNRWARDDPAFIVVLVCLLAAASVAWSLALRAPTALARIFILFVGWQFLFYGVIVASCGWFIAETYLKVRKYGIVQNIEWMYAFDIHCNAFFPLFVILYVVQLFLLPVLMQATLLATCLSNALYAGALAYYFFVTSLGYGQLPFLENTEVFLWPAVPIFFLAFLLCLMQVNLTRVSIAAMGLADYM